MSVVIIGGNECMVCQYEKICKAMGARQRCLQKKEAALKRSLAVRI